MIKDDVDIILDLLRRARTVSTGVAEIEWRRVEVEARAAWGGSRPYVPKAPAEKKTTDVGECVGRGMSLADAARTVGISLRYARRLAGRRWKRLGK